MDYRAQKRLEGKFLFVCIPRLANKMHVTYQDHTRTTLERFGDCFLYNILTTDPFASRVHRLHSMLPLGHVVIVRGTRVGRLPQRALYRTGCYWDRNLF